MLLHQGRLSFFQASGRIAVVPRVPQLAAAYERGFVGRDHVLRRDLVRRFTYRFKYFALWANKICMIVMHTKQPIITGVVRLSLLGILFLF